MMVISVETAAWLAALVGGGAVAFMVALAGWYHAETTAECLRERLRRAEMKGGVL